MMAWRQRPEQEAMSELHRLEERHRGLTSATQEWLSLLQEMEGNGETSDPRYERYYRAYIEAKQQEKRADLELFNVRSGLVS